MQPRCLLALDMDGTLLRDDKSIAPEDIEAIRGAGANGIAVTLATGRLTTGALPTAQLLGLSTPLICADGALLVDAENGAAISQRALPHEDVHGVLEVFAEHDLTPFVFLANAIHCDASGERHRPFIDTWTRHVVVHGSLASGAWRSDSGVAMTLGIGEAALVEQASEHLRTSRAEAMDTVHFGMAGTSVWAVRSLPRGCDKGEMLARLAARMQLPAARVAVVGDWLNDLGMFAFAGRAFAMGQAPEIVREAATDVLQATSRRGGGVAEAIAALLESGFV